MAGKRGEGKTTTMTGADWQRILRIMDEVYADYLTRMATLRERVVMDLKRKLSDSKVLDHPRESSTPRSAPASRRR